MMPRMTLLTRSHRAPLARLRVSRLPAAATTCLRWCRADAPPRQLEGIGQTDVMAELRGDETVELLQTLIRNACVNDGTEASGQEIRNADVLTTYLEGAGLEVEQFHAAPGRTSIVARLEGTDPEAPSLCLNGHTDVVPINPDGWDEDPFGGEIIDGEVWGRGAVDMLNLTASMAVVTRNGPFPLASRRSRVFRRGRRGGGRMARFMGDTIPTPSAPTTS